MEILKIDLSRLRNDEHYEFHTDVAGLVTGSTPEALGVERAFPAYQAACDNEGGALHVVRESTFTGPVADADSRRDSIGGGMSDMVKAATRHFDPAVREAARRLTVVFDSFGNIAVKGYNEETAAINSLVNDLETQYAADVTALGIGDWVAGLQSANVAFAALMQERYSEEAAKTQLTMKEARVQLDGAYRAITERIGALIIVNGERGYESFVAELNQRIERYNNMVALREGRNAGEEESGQ
jgi:hypothetical protein